MAKRNSTSKTSVSRRNFLAVGGVSVVGLTLAGATSSRQTKQRAVIQIVMNGGASQLETFDPKPEAPREVRGPIHSIDTSIPGVRFSECLPKLAQRADQLVVLRSLHHQAAPIHETGLQLLLTGDMVKLQYRPPHIGFVLQKLLKATRNIPIAVELGGSPHHTGVNAYHGTESGILDDASTVTSLPHLEDLEATRFDVPDFTIVDNKVKDQYGKTRFGELMWTAARLVEAGVRHVTVHTFAELEGQKTWDAHGDAEVGPATIFDYRDSIGPQFDLATAALLDDLHQSGRSNNTLIICSGEMGRNPKLNEANGRDHWTNVWSGFLAGGGLNGGQVIGASDETASEIKDNPIELQQLPALALEYLGVQPGTIIPINSELAWRTPETSLVVG